jgi:hypothetical protein
VINATIVSTPPVVTEAFGIPDSSGVGAGIVFPNP